MAQRYHVHGYEGFYDLVKTIPSGERINVLFTGTKVNGVSWCPDCVEGEPRQYNMQHFHHCYSLPAEPFIEKAVEEFSLPGSHFVVVEVGDRPL